MGAMILAGCSGKSPSAQCEAFSADRATSILSGAGLVVDQAAAVKSTEHSKAWYVAIRFRGAGIEDGGVGVWATNDLVGGSIVSVDAVAKEFSSFPPDDAFAVTDKGAEDVRTCVQG